MPKVNTTQTDKLFRELESRMESLPQDALKEFVKNTPRRSGNARRSTRLDKTTIVADYPYAQRLDEGYSQKSPDGMTQPTQDWIEQEVNRRLKGL